MTASLTVKNFTDFLLNPGFAREASAPSAPTRIAGRLSATRKDFLPVPIMTRQLNQDAVDQSIIDPCLTSDDDPVCITNAFEPCLEEVKKMKLPLANVGQAVHACIKNSCPSTTDAFLTCIH